MFRNFFKKPTATPKTDEISGAFTHTIKLPVAFLKKLIPIGELSLEKLNAMHISTQYFQSGDVIFTRGDLTDSLPYLQKGEVFLEAGNGEGYYVDSETFKACYPLSTGCEYKLSAFAKTPVNIVYIPLDALKNSQIATNNPIINPGEEPEELAGSAFFQGICQTYRRNELRVPSLPDIALRLRTALQKEIDIIDVVKIINLDSVISSKLIQVVNSPLYRSLNPSASCLDAVNRLGIKNTQNLVTSISLKNLFISNNKQLNKKIQSIWKQSIYVASLSFTLAGISKSVDPDEALLAGLIHNIGALPVITFAETFDSNLYNESELDQSIEVLEGTLGVSILKSWRFPARIQQIPVQTANWYYDDGENLQLNDIVLLAKLHSLLGSSQTHKLPPIYTLPAFHKLGNFALTPEMSLQALLDSKHQIAEALSFFKT
jgi:HD-like signal output (HDOD) protein